MLHSSGSFATTLGRVAVLVMFTAAFAVPPMWANIIAYQATSFAPDASLGSTSFGSCPSGNPFCVVVTVSFLANTANIVPFSVPGAHGYENFVGNGSVNLFNDQTGQSVSANFLSGQIYVSVDQANGGVGFGSSVGPTYPLGVYGGTTSPVPYSSYNLASNFTVNGFAWFCPPGTCQLGVAGPDLATDQGPLSITPVGPVGGSSFNATVVQVTTPEPSSSLMFATMMAGIMLSCELKSPLRILRRLRLLAGLR